jgi:hypothetical protein
MSEPVEYAGKAVLLREIAKLVYGLPRQATEAIPIEDVYDALPEERASAIDSALKKMDALELISLELKKPSIRTLGHGKACFEQNCVPEVILGADYIAKKYRKAIVHIIIERSDGVESGGTGFFWADYLHQLVTAGHVVNGHRIKRIEDSDGNSIAFTGEQVKVGPPDLDLAMVACEMPAGVEPLRVEWKINAVSLGAGLIVFGYPKIAFHHPSLYQSRAELHAIPRRYSSPRDSLIISGTHPGCSGGPVVDLRGFAIGVIEQENVIEHQSGANVYFSATPACYLRELISLPL